MVPDRSGIEFSLKTTILLRTNQDEKKNHQNDKKQLPPAVVKDIESLRKKSADGEVLIDKLKSELRIQLDKRKLQNEQFTVMRELLAQAQSELKTRAAEVSEIKGDVYQKQNKFDDARLAYSSALEKNANNPLLQMKLDNLSVATGQ